MSDELNSTTTEQPNEVDSFFGEDDLSEILSSDGGNEDPNAIAEPGVNAQQQQLPEGGEVQPQGFDQHFYDEKGDFNLDASMDFVQSNLSQNSEVPNFHSQVHTVQQQQPVQPASNDPELPEWERQFNERTEARKAHDAKYFTFRDFINKAAEEGYEGQEIFRRAEVLARETSDREWAKEEHKRSFEAKAAEDARFKEERSFSEMLPRSRANLGAFYQNFKDGEKGFNDFMFGPEVTGENGAKGRDYKKAFGVEAINYAFKLQNDPSTIPDPQKDPKGALDHYEKWWTRFSSDPQNLQHIYDLAVTKLHMQHMKHSAAALKARGAQLQQQKVKDANRGASNLIQRKQPVRQEQSADSFNSMIQQSDFVDTV